MDITHKEKKSSTTDKFTLMKNRGLSRKRKKILGRGVQHLQMKTTQRKIGNSHYLWVEDWLELKKTLGNTGYIFVMLQE